MRAGRQVQPLSYQLRLPDASQADALRLLEVSRQVINARYSYGIWWIILAASANTLWASIFVSVESRQAISLWREAHPTSSDDTCINLPAT